MTRVGDVGFMLGIVVLVAGTGTASISRLIAHVADPGTPGWVWPVGLLCLVAGIAGKSAQFPLHTWLPDAMEGPTPVSALIHAATMVAAGAYVVARLLPLFAHTAAARDVLAGIACVSMLGAALAAFGQTDLKRLLAYSTISQVAYMLAGLAVTPPADGPAAGIAHLLAHAGFKALLFLSAGALAYLAGTTALAGLSGAWRRSPLVAVSFTVGLAALAGVPPLSGFWSKEAVLGAAEQGARHGDVRVAAWCVLVVGLLTGAVTAAYATRAWLLVVPSAGRTPTGVPAEQAPGEPPEGTTGASHDQPPRPADEPQRVLPAAMTVPLLVLVAVTVLGGLVQVGGLLPGHLELSAVTALLALVLLAAAAYGCLTLARRAPLGDPITLLPRRFQLLLLEAFGLDALQHRLVVRPTRALARLVVGGDREVVDAYVRATPLVTRWSGVLLRRAQSGRTTSYLTWLFAGVVVAGIAGVSLR